jgi:hypothetical protein
MDQTEKSNLSRQFLFRDTDINSPKSTTAVRAVTAMSLAFHAVTYESKVRVCLRHYVEVRSDDVRVPTQCLYSKPGRSATRKQLLQLL